MLVNIFVGRESYGAPYALVQSGYSPRIVQLIKQLDYYDREWVPGPKLWKVKSPLAADLLYSWLKREGFQVTVHDPDEIIWRKAKKPASAPQTAVPDWAEAMFQALPPELHSAAYSALLKVLHPDRAGDAGTEAMKTLNAARDKVKELSR